MSSLPQTPWIARFRVSFFTASSFLHTLISIAALYSCFPTPSFTQLLNLSCSVFHTTWYFTSSFVVNQYSTASSKWSVAYLFGILALGPLHCHGAFPFTAALAHTSQPFPVPPWHCTTANEANATHTSVRLSSAKRFRSMTSVGSSSRHCSRGVESVPDLPHCVICSTLELSFFWSWGLRNIDFIPTMNLEWSSTTPVICFSSKSFSSLEKLETSTLQCLCGSSVAKALVETILCLSYSWDDSSGINRTIQIVKTLKYGRALPVVSTHCTTWRLGKSSWFTSEHTYECGSGTACGYLFWGLRTEGTRVHAWAPLFHIECRTSWCCVRKNSNQDWLVQLVAGKQKASVWLGNSLILVQRLNCSTIPSGKLSWSIAGTPAHSSVWSQVPGTVSMWITLGPASVYSSAKRVFKSG